MQIDFPSDLNGIICLPGIFAGSCIIIAVIATTSPSYFATSVNGTYVLSIRNSSSNGSFKVISTSSSFIFVALK